MKLKELTKLFMISNWENPLVSMVYTEYLRIVSVKRDLILDFYFLVVVNKDLCRAIYEFNVHGLTLLSLRSI